MKFKGLNDNKLSNQAEISNGLIGKARKRGSLSGKNISKLINTYQDLSADWLFTGQGSMLKQNNNQESLSEDDKDYIINLQKKTIKILEDKIRELEKN
ncbi:hypothetical protein [Flavobacterium sp. CS20]|uniref:hypothetical protein n=1 Tax=Flavobacterium sp. CS20 TaxID=2775246 RepID=UPI001B39FCE7|nr:hypothetical protein [Flavobacterium sp. CS20]QTY26358.1 hypothetical protein IGB25_10445 [Flavobacterium sp. CS20]